MEADEAADKIREAKEEKEEQRSESWFRTQASIAIAVLAMLLAIASLGREDATKETINSNILASDTWAFYQAKNIRQTDYQLASDELNTMLLLNTETLSADTQKNIRNILDRYKATIERFESEPDLKEPNNPLAGTGKKELQQQAQAWEEKRNHAQERVPNFDYSAAIFQIAIVLGSVSIVANSRRILGLALVAGVIAFLLMMNGFFLFMRLPIG